MELSQFLIYVASGGGAAALVSFAGERLPWFQRQTSRVKSYLMLGASIIVALGAWAVMTYVPADVLAQVRVPFQIVAGVVSAWLANQFAHANDPAAG